LHLDDKEAALKKTSILMSRGHLVQVYRFRSKDGHYLWIRDEASLLRDADGRPMEIIGLRTNITERKQAEERAAQARKKEFQKDKLIVSSDRNVAVGTVIAILIFGSFLWGITDIGLTIFVVSCNLGLILIWLVVALIILTHGSTPGDRSLCPDLSDALRDDGGLLLLWYLGYNFSVAVWVGYIARFGIAVEIGVVMGRPAQTEESGGDRGSKTSQAGGAGPSCVNG
jgi:type IV secretory pathway TrbD component